MASLCQQQDKMLYKVKFCKSFLGLGYEPWEKNTWHVQQCQLQWFILLLSWHRTSCQVLSAFHRDESCLPVHSATITTDVLRAVDYFCIGVLLCWYRKVDADLVNQPSLSKSQGRGLRNSHISIHHTSSCLLHRREWGEYWCKWCSWAGE